MKLKQKSVTPTASGHFIAIGTRGTALIMASQLPEGVKVGENPPMAKTGRDPKTAPWLIANAWISARPNPFVVLPVKDALKRGLVRLFKVSWTHKASGKTFTGEALLPKSWDTEQKTPYSVAVLPTKGWTHGRVESSLVAERPKEGKKVESRNAHLVASLKFA